MIDEFKASAKPKVPDNTIRLFWERQKVFNGFENKILSREKQGQRKGLKLLTPKQMLRKLYTAIAQVQAGNTSEHLLNEIHQKIYYLYQAKEIIKKVCNNIINSIKL